jgi:hypothetical protein
MQNAENVKIVGRRNRPEDGNPASYRLRALALQVHADRINPYPKPRGFVFKARTWQEYESWRSSQDNPRLW